MALLIMTLILLELVFIPAEGIALQMFYIRTLIILKSNRVIQLLELNGEVIGCKRTT